MGEVETGVRRAGHFLERGPKACLSVSLELWPESVTPVAKELLPGAQFLELQGRRGVVRSQEQEH